MTVGWNEVGVECCLVRWSYNLMCVIVRARVVLVFRFVVSFVPSRARFTFVQFPLIQSTDVLRLDLYLQSSKRGQNERVASRPSLSSVQCIVTDTVGETSNPQASAQVRDGHAPGYRSQSKKRGLLTEASWLHRRRRRRRLAKLVPK